MAETISRKYPCPAIVAVIHGMKDATANTSGNGGVFLLGAAYENETYDPETATIGERNQEYPYATAPGQAGTRQRWRIPIRRN